MKLISNMATDLQFNGLSWQGRYSESRSANFKKQGQNLYIQGHNIEVTDTIQNFSPTKELIPIYLLKEP